MARLQDFQSVTPTGSDNLLIVQAQGQGLSTLNAVGQKVANDTTISSLATTAKTIVGAINENKSNIDNKTASNIEYSSGVTVKQAIDSKQDTLSTTSGTITANSSGGWSANGWCKKYGNLVSFYIDGNKSSALASGWNTVATLPSGFRPNDAFDFAMIDPGSDYASEGKVNTDGTVQVYKNSNSTTRIRCQTTFII